MRTLAQRVQFTKTQAASAKAYEVFATHVLPVIAEVQGTGVSTYLGIANALNQRGVKAARGGKWHAKTVSRVMARR